MDKSHISFGHKSTSVPKAFDQVCRFTSVNFNKQIHEFSHNDFMQFVTRKSFKHTMRNQFNLLPPKYWYSKLYQTDYCNGGVLSDQSPL